MIFYSSIILFSVFMAHVSDKLDTTIHRYGKIIITKDIFLKLSFFILFFITAFRLNVGKDYPAYVEIFENIKNGQNQLVEGGYLLLNKSILLFTANYQWVFVLSAAIMYFFIYLALKNNVKYKAFAIYLFCAMSFLFYSFNISRQFISIAIALYTWKYLRERNFVAYLFFIVFASIFHRTALVLLPIYFLVNIDYKKWQYFIITALATCAALFKDEIAEFLLGLYPQYDKSSQVVSLITRPSEIFVVSISVAILLIIYLYKKQIISFKNKVDRISVNYIFFMFIMNFILFWIPLSDRVSLYLNINLIIILPYLIERVKNANIRKLAIISIIVITVVYNYVSVVLNDSHRSLPYRNVLLSNQEYK